MGGRKGSPLRKLNERVEKLTAERRAVTTPSRQQRQSAQRTMLANINDLRLQLRTEGVYTTNSEMLECAHNILTASLKELNGTGANDVDHHILWTGQLESVAWCLNAFKERHTTDLGPQGLHTQPWQPPEPPAYPITPQGYAVVWVDDPQPAPQTPLSGVTTD